MAILNTIEAVQRNGYINSNFDYWQRGTSFTNPASNSYTADRWAIGGSPSGTYVVSRAAFGQQIEVPNNPKYYMRLQATSLASPRDLRQNIEGVGSYANETVTVSFWGRVASGTYTATAGVGFFQNFGTGGSPSGQVSPTGQNITLTSTWTKYSFTFSIPSIVGKTLGTNNNDYISFYVNTPGTGTFDAHFAQFMINEGAQTQSWNLAGINQQGELAMCQRYYEKSYDVDAALGTNTAVGIATGATIAGLTTRISMLNSTFKIPKRAAPTTTVIYAEDGTVGSVSDYSNSTTKVASAPNSPGTVNLGRFLSGTGYSASLYYVFHWTVDSEL